MWACSTNRDMEALRYSKQLISHISQMSSIKFCWLAIGQNYFSLFVRLHENYLGYIFFPYGKAPPFLQGWLKLLEIFILGISFFVL